MFKRNDIFKTTTDEVFQKFSEYIDVIIYGSALSSCFCLKLYFISGLSSFRGKVCLIGMFCYAPVEEPSKIIV